MRLWTFGLCWSTKPTASNLYSPSRRQHMRYTKPKHSAIGWTLKKIYGTDETKPLDTTHILYTDRLSMIFYIVNVNGGRSERNGFISRQFITPIKQREE